jgi:uncharacterized protein (DUF58 family)
LFSGVRQSFKKKLDSWIKARLPEQVSVTLNQSRIFIVPTFQGLMLLVVAIGLLLLAINFETPLNYGFAFWLIAMLFVSVHLTYRNMTGLTITALPGSLVGPRETCGIPIRLTSKSKRHRGTIELIHPEWGVVHANLQQGEGHCVLPVTAKQRGPIKLPRFRIESRFPFGLVVAWSHLQLSSCGWAYPESIEGRRQIFGGTKDDDNASLNDHFLIAGSEDFHQLREYSPGDAISRLHWPSFSKDQLVVKTFSDYQQTDEWLDWNQFPHLENENKLSALASLAENYYAQQRVYGLRLPSCEVPMGQGGTHLQQVRQALAEFGYE